MRLGGSPDLGHLTYCTNIHAGEDWPDVEASLRRHLPEIKNGFAPDRPMGVGLRLGSIEDVALDVEHRIETAHDPDDAQQPVVGLLAQVERRQQQAAAGQHTEDHPEYEISNHVFESVLAVYGKEIEAADAGIGV